MALRLSDIRDHGPRLRIHKEEIEGVGEFELHEFPANEFWEVSERMVDVNNPMTPSEIASVVIRIIEGYNYKPKQTEIKDVLANLGKGALEHLLLAWLQFSRRGQTSDETVKE